MMEFPEKYLETPIHFRCSKNNTECFQIPETVFPDMACMKGVYKNKKNIVPLVGSQEQRVLLVLVINR